MSFSSKKSDKSSGTFDILILLGLYYFISLFYNMIAVFRSVRAFCSKATELIEKEKTKISKF